MKRSSRLTGRLLLVAGVLAGWELSTRRMEKNRMASGMGFWRNYYDPETLTWADQIRQPQKIQSTGVTIHIDLYPQDDLDAPAVIFNHGIAGYCRLFLPLAQDLFTRGYTVILPDQRGQGFSGGVRGDHPVDACAQNIQEVAYWARRRFGGPLFMAGGSMGGALTYYAAAAGAPVDAIACLNLFDFGQGRDGIGISRLSRLESLPGVRQALPAGVKLLAPLGWLRIPFALLARYEGLMDSRDNSFYALWNADPVPPRLVSLRTLASYLSTPPAVSLEENRTPTLVLNQALDRMVDPSVTRRNYERLGGEKRYGEIPFGHWSVQPAFWATIARFCDTWYRSHSL